MAHLTKAVVEAAKAPVVGQRFVRDDAIKGFALRVIATGAKSWVWEGRVAGRVRRITLGRHPDMKCAAARDEALKLRAAIADGRDPFLEREAEKHEPTFGDLRKRYIEEHAKPHKRSWLRDERRLQRCKAWDGRRLSDITVADVLKLQQKLEQENGRIEANRMLELLRAVFNKGGCKKGCWGIAESNPVLGFERYTEVQRDRFLSEAELKRLNDALVQEPEPWPSYFALLLLTGLRKMELLGARWADVDFDAGTLRLGQTKNGKPRHVPLPAVAVEILRALPSRDDTSGWIFPTTGHLRSKTGHLTDAKSAWKRLRRRAKLSDATVHDLRRTLGSRLAIAGANLPTIAGVLGHSGLSAVQVYARINVEAERRALNANAATLPLTLPAPANGAAK